MGKNLRWKIPLIIIVIAIGIAILYPPAEKVIKKEHVKEIDGKVVERTPVEKSFARFFVTNPMKRETIINEETDEDGRVIRTKAIEYVTKGKIKLGLDLKGGSELLYKVRVDEREDHPGLTNEIMEVLKKRIDPQGVIEYRIQEHGSRRILIQVPGATRAETEALKNRITRLGKLEFRLGASQDSPEYKDALEGKKVPGYYKHWLRKRKGEKGEEGKWFLVRNKTEISGEHLSRIFADRKGIEPVVGFEFNAIGKTKFGQITERNIGKPLAIILDGVLYSAPTIRDRIPGKGIIEGSFTQDEVNELIAVMRAGSLPADLELEMETMVGPSLGRDSINKGLIAGAIGGIFAILFIGIYYLGVGWVANCANALNVFLIIGTMALLKATMTLPGIAGLVLMIGMGIDANVLIYERIREERQRGKPIRTAIKAGYEKAFSAIFDSNITTLITGVILAAVGTGPVKGFAWTLILGLIINLFTAIFVTRVIYELFLDWGWIRNFSMLRLIGVPKIKFFSTRYILLAVSLVFVFGGMTTFVVRGSKKYDIDFTGGTLVHLHLDSQKEAGFIRTELKNTGYEEAEVQSILTGENLSQFTSTSNEFGIRIKELNEGKTKQKITEDIKGVLGPAGLFASIDFIEPTYFNLKLQKPADELSIQNSLWEAGYSEEDIESIVSSNQTTDAFLLNVIGLDEDQKRLQIMSALVEVLKDHISYENFRLTLGDIIETLQAQEANMPVTGPYIEVETSEPISPDTLNLELNRQGYQNILVTSQSRESSTALSSRLKIEGPRSVLQKIKQAVKERISTPNVFNIDNKQVRVELKKQLGKADFLAKINKSRVIRKNTKSVYTLNAPAQEFAVRLKTLSAGKIQEKIKEDIINTFKEDLYKEKIGVSFELLEEAPEVTLADDTGTLGAAGQQNTEREIGGENNSGPIHLRMKLSKPLKKEEIESILASVGFAGVLEEGLDEGKEYQSVRIACGEKRDPEVVKSTLTTAFEIPNPLKRVVSIGSTVADEMKSRAILGVFFACVATIFYVWLRFGDFRYGSAAIIAVIHDILVTLGVVAMADYLFGNMKIDSAMVAAFLTVVGYSLNDTIVVFDRIRENVSGRGKILSPQLVNESINQTLSRTILTSVTTIGVLCALFFLGGSEIHGFAFVMLVGIIVGTYSTIFIACPMLLRYKDVSPVKQVLPQQKRPIKGKKAIPKNA